MKKTCTAIAAAAMLLCSSPPFSAAAADLADSTYLAFIVCSDTVGKYCEQGRIATDTFVFNGSAFSIQSLDSFGDYSSAGYTFDADCTAIDGLDEYAFDIQGITIFDRFLFGTMDLQYRENLGIIGDASDGTALFFAMKQ